MTAYLEQINKKIDMNKRKLASLEEYKQALLSKQGELDNDSLSGRLEQIEEEFSRLQKSLHANSKAKAHYDAAYKHLLDLRVLDSRLQSVTNPTIKEEIEREIIMHTEKLQKHLTILPEKLVIELQQNYLAATQNQPLTVTEEDSVETSGPSSTTTEVQTKPISIDENTDPTTTDVNVPTEPTSMDETIMAAVDNASTMDITDTNENATYNEVETADEVFRELIQIFDDEKREMSEIGAFDTKEELEVFLDKYKNLKMECHARLLDAINTNLEVNIKTETTRGPSNMEVIESEELPEIPVTGDSPIIIMLDLVDKLEITNEPTQKLHPVNIKISDNFKEELKNGNWLYNVIHFTAELISATEESGPELIEELSKIGINQERIAILSERVANLPKINLAKVYNEYYANSSKARLTTALKILLDEAINKLA